MFIALYLVIVRLPKMKFLSVIKSLLKAVWDKIKKQAVYVLRFLTNIVAFFKDPNRLGKLKENKDRIAVAIKEKLDNGDYEVVNCLFDKEQAELVDPEEDAEVISASELDEETLAQFKEKDMLVLT